MKKRLLFVMFFVASIVFAQTLTVGTATGLPGTVVRIPLTLSNSNTQTAGLQWVLKFGKTISINLVAGPVAVATGKVPECSSVVGTLVTVTCTLDGVNKNILTDGVVAYLDVTLPTVFSGTVGISITGTVGTTIDAHTINVAAVAGKVSKGTSTAVNKNNLSDSSDDKLTEVGLTQSMKDINCDADKNRDIKCLVTLNSPMEDGSYFSPFVTRTDLFLNPNQVWVEKGETSFSFNVLNNSSQNQNSSVVLGVVYGEETIIGIVSVKK